jgi:hypothetical protein
MLTTMASLVRATHACLPLFCYAPPLLSLNRRRWGGGRRHGMANVCCGSRRKCRLP